MSAAFLSAAFGKQLHAVGLVPPHCRRVELLAYASDSALVLRYDVFVQIEDLPKLVAAIQATYDAAQAHDREWKARSTGEREPGEEG
jgi:hypothetical protein